jgi:dihydroxyacid dehydratase/phosphogluconate dehydratase
MSFCEAIGLKGPNSSSVLVLNAKRGEIKAKATRSATTCVSFKSFSVRILYCKTALLWGINLIMGKGGVFLCLIKSSLQIYFDLPKQVFLT